MALGESKDFGFQTTSKRRGNKKASEIRRPFLNCGPYWIRTSDPLLVRQVL